MYFKCYYYVWMPFEEICIWPSIPIVRLRDVVGTVKVCVCDCPIDTYCLWDALWNDCWMYVYIFVCENAYMLCGIFGRGVHVMCVT